MAIVERAGAVIALPSKALHFETPGYEATSVAAIGAIAASSIDSACHARST